MPCIRPCYFQICLSVSLHFSMCLSPSNPRFAAVRCNTGLDRAKEQQGLQQTIFFLSAVAFMFQFRYREVNMKE